MWHSTWSSIRVNQALPSYHFLKADGDIINSTVLESVVKVSLITHTNFWTPPVTLTIIS